VSSIALRGGRGTESLDHRRGAREFDLTALFGEERGGRWQEHLGCAVGGRGTCLRGRAPEWKRE
jgi:hypothetical protein